jgi:hypothetical protein
VNHRTHDDAGAKVLEEYHLFFGATVSGDSHGESVE